jgi:hypothetical protein
MVRRDPSHCLSTSDATILKCLLSHWKHKDAFRRRREQRPGTRSLAPFVHTVLRLKQASPNVIRLLILILYHKDGYGHVSAMGRQLRSHTLPPPSSHLNWVLPPTHKTLVKRKVSIKVTRRYRSSSCYMYYEVLFLSFLFSGFSFEVNNKRFPPAVDHVFSHVFLIIESSRTHPIRKTLFGVSFGSSTNLPTLLRGLVAHRHTRTRPTTG